MDIRYSRQEVLSLIGKEGQDKLCKSSVVVVGCGALGSAAAELLARAGVGSITLIDHDVVDLTNLQRQSLYTEADISMPKASALKAHLEEINSTIAITAHEKHLNFENIGSLLKGAQLLLDCTDNIDTRLLINEFCVKNRLPWIHSAAIQEKGVVLVMLPGGPCFRCIFPKVVQVGSCEELGILNSTSHITAATQVVEAIKILTGHTPDPDMIRINTWTHEVEKFQVKPLSGCHVCKEQFKLLEGDLPEFTINECKAKKGFSVKPKRNLKMDLEGIKKKFDVKMDASILLVIDYEGEIIVHGFGELLFKDLKDKERIQQIADEIYKAGGVKSGVVK
ncbi:MAG: HesA/MoeB/ThiF family protein [Candidatus Woesearchaeota archaeon]